MTERKRVACFFTGGFTELNAMKLFVKKINNGVDYIQLCPIGRRKSKNDINRRHTDNIVSQQNGLTGQDLVNYVLGEVEKQYFQEEDYDAILIEDDKDARFLQLQPDGHAIIDKEAWAQYKQHIKEQLSDKCPGIPVFFLLAAPEVEAWFISDWKNTFNGIYTNVLNGPQNSFFTTKFRKYVKDTILTRDYLENIESYGYFNGSYKKLSEEIQNALEENDFLSGCMPVFEYSHIRYSKRIHGEIMLERADPEIISACCSSFFREGFTELKQL